MSLCRKKCTMYSWCHFILGTTYIEKTCVNICLYSSMNQAYIYNKTATRFSQTKQYAQYTQRMILLGKHIHWLDVFRSQQVVFDFSIHVEFKATPTSPLVDWEKSLFFLWSDPSLKIIWKLPLTLKIIWQLLKMIVFFCAQPSGGRSWSSRGSPCWRGQRGWLLQVGAANDQQRRTDFVFLGISIEHIYWKSSFFVANTLWQWWIFHCHVLKNRSFVINRATRVSSRNLVTIVSKLAFLSPI